MLTTALIDNGYIYYPKHINNLILILYPDLYHTHLVFMRVPGDENVDVELTLHLREHVLLPPRNNLQGGSGGRLCLRESHVMLPPRDNLKHRPAGQSKRRCGQALAI